MNIPKELQYTKSHEWVRREGEDVLVGLTDFAQEQLGDLVFINLPNVGDGMNVGDALADVESVKAVSDVYCPVKGVVKAVNETLLDAPESVNQSPYAAWLARLTDIEELGELMDAAAYEELVAKEG